MLAVQQGDNFIQRVCDQIERLVTHDPRSELGFFVASFSRAADDLGQWRGYGDDGRGFAVGFAPGLFHVMMRANSHNFGDPDSTHRLRRGQRTRSEQAAPISAKLLQGYAASLYCEGP